MMRNLNYRLLLRKEPEGEYTVTVPALGAVLASLRGGGAGRKDLAWVGPRRPQLTRRNLNPRNQILRLRDRPESKGNDLTPEFQR